MYLKPVIPWATEVTYPPGAQPWSGQPLSVIPVSDYFTPSTKPPAQFFNYLFSSNAVQADLLQTYALASSLTNWCPEFDVHPVGLDLGIAWDPRGSTWLLLVSDISTSALSLQTSYGLDEGAAWTVWFTGFSPATTAIWGACCYDPETALQFYVAYSDSTSTHNILNVYQLVGSTWTQDWTVTGGGNFYGVELATLPTSTGTTNTTTVVAWASTDSHSGLAYHNSVLNPWPANNVWPPVYHFVPFGIAAMNAGDTIYLKSNGAQIVCIPSTTATGGYTVWQSADGSTWTSSASLAGLAPSGGKVVGLCWTQDALGLCWLACVKPSSGAPLFFRSGDGVTWTLQSGGMTTAFVVVDMAAVGSHVVCTLADASSGGPSGATFSVDGGISWYFSQAVFSTNQAVSDGRQRSRIVSSSVGFMSSNAIWQRFSGLAGLPPTQL